MRTLRRLLGHIALQLGMEVNETTIASLLSTLDYFDRNPTEYLDLYRDSI